MKRGVRVLISIRHTLDDVTSAQDAVGIDLCSSKAARDFDEDAQLTDAEMMTLADEARAGWHRELARLRKRKDRR